MVRVSLAIFAWVAATAVVLATSTGPAHSRGTVVVLGDSIAAGHGIDPSEAFPALLQKEIDRAGLSYDVINAGVSGDTTAGGVRRVNWILRRPVDVLVVELGGNDGLRGLPLEATRSNLVAIIETARSRRPGIQVVLAGMQMPPNLGSDYTRRFREIYPEVATAKHIPLIAYLLEGVGGRPELNQADLIHPTARGHQVIAENVWTILKPILEKRRAAE